MIGHNGPEKSRGFTLIEMLVVVGILTALLALLQPALQTWREGSRRMVCASRMRQCSMACITYAGDSNRWFPFPRNDDEIPGLDHVWHVGTPCFNAISERLDSIEEVLYCPNYAASGGGAVPAYVEDNRWVMGFGYVGGYDNTGWTGPLYDFPRRMTADPTLYLWVDVIYYYPGAVLWGPHSRRGAIGVNREATPQEIGLEGCNVGRLDGSVAWKDIDDTSQYSLCLGALAFGYW